MGSTPQDAYVRPSGKSCVILGGAEGVYDEWLLAQEFGPFDHTFGVNDIACFHSVSMCTLHPKKFAQRKRGYCFSYAQVSGVDELIDYKWKDERGNILHSNSGSSGLYAIKVALDLGFDKIVICGIHMDRNVNQFTGLLWHDQPLFQDVWTKVLPQMRGKVWSMGGWTKELLNPNENPPKSTT